MSIKSFQIDSIEKNLTINFIKGETVCLSAEYLRVLTPTYNSSNKQQALVTHKKNITLIAIESVGKHGYRLIFDDQHNAIYSAQYLKILAVEHSQRWQHYLTELKASGHSREAMIDITQL